MSALDRRRAFRETLAKKERRKLEGRREDRSIWSWMGLFGLVGWSVALPALACTALGAWLDRAWPAPFSWTLSGLGVGVVLGCLLAWRWVREESGS